MPQSPLLVPLPEPMPSHPLYGLSSPSRRITTPVTATRGRPLLSIQPRPSTKTANPFNTLRHCLHQFSSLSAMKSFLPGAIEPQNCGLQLRLPVARISPHFHNNIMTTLTCRLGPLAILGALPDEYLNNPLDRLSAATAKPGSYNRDGAQSGSDAG